MSDIPGSFEGGRIDLPDTAAHALTEFIDVDADATNDTIVLCRHASVAETAIGGSNVELNATANGVPVKGRLMPDDTDVIIQIRDLSKVYLRTRTANAQISYIRTH